jgi:hypothetical protein
MRDADSGVRYQSGSKTLRTSAVSTAATGQLVDGLRCGGEHLLATARLLERAAPLIAMDGVFPANLVGADVSLRAFKEGLLLSGFDAFGRPLGISFESGVVALGEHVSGLLSQFSGLGETHTIDGSETHAVGLFEDWIGESKEPTLRAELGAHLKPETLAIAGVSFGVSDVDCSEPVLLPSHRGCP